MPQSARCARKPPSTTSRSIGASCSWRRVPTTRARFPATTSPAARRSHIILPVSPELGVPEHHEARWVDYHRALTMVSPRLMPVVHWAYRIINHGLIPARMPPHQTLPRRRLPRPIRPASGTSRIEVSRRQLAIARRRAAAELDHIASDPDPRARGHFEVKRRGTPHELALRDLDPGGERPLHRKPPTAEVRGRRTGRRILEHGRAARKEKRARVRPGPFSANTYAMPMPSSLRIAANARGSGAARRTASTDRKGHDQLLLTGLHPKRSIADIAIPRGRAHRPARRWSPPALGNVRARGGQGPAIAHRVHLDQPRLHVQAQRIAPETERAADVSRSQGGMACKRHLVVGVKMRTLASAREEAKMNVVSDKLN